MSENKLLVINNISVVYSDVIQVLKGVSLTVEPGQVVSLLGSNGAGKTTTLKAISGLLKPENGEVTEGSVLFDGKPIHNHSPETITRAGIIQVLEGRQPFKYLTIEENLRVGTATRWGKPYKQDLEKVYQYFPALTKRRKTLAGYCSGGEMQMLVIGRALMAHPKLLLLDEPSLGLAPLIVLEIFQIIERINRGRHDDRPRGAERQHGPADCHLRVRHGKWEDRHGGPGRGTTRESRREGILPGHGRRRDEILPGCESV